MMSQNANKVGIFHLDYWKNRFYSDASAYDPFAYFLRLLENVVRADSEVLDLGAGRGFNNVYDFKGRVKRIVGVDMDPEVVNNPLLDEGLPFDGKRIPYPDQSFDVVFSVYVMEHVEHPELYWSEVRRVLKPGGVYLGLTPNLYNYVSVIALLTSVKFHAWVNRLRGFPIRDMFPTFYRMNTESAVRKQLAQHGFTDTSVKYFESQPNYLKFNIFAFLLGVSYERLVNRFEMLRSLKVNLIVESRKK